MLSAAPSVCESPLLGGLFLETLHCRFIVLHVLPKAEAAEQTGAPCKAHGYPAQAVGSRSCPSLTQPLSQPFTKLDTVDVRPRDLPVVNMKEAKDIQFHCNLPGGYEQCVASTQISVLGISSCTRSGAEL